MPRASTGVHRFAGDELAVDRQFEILKRRVRRERKEIIRLANPAAAIHKSLIDLVLKHVVGELDAHVAPRPLDPRPAVPNGDGNRAIVRLLNGNQAWPRDDPTLGSRAGRNDNEYERAKARGHTAHDELLKGSDRRRRSPRDLHTARRES